VDLAAPEANQNESNVAVEVGNRIDAAVALNRKHEDSIIILCVLMTLSGLTLLLWGAFKEQWTVIVSGGALQSLVFFPIRKLIKLRENNVILQVVPQLLRLANDVESKRLAASLVQKLIKAH
jgi:hypothetical protein